MCTVRARRFRTDPVRFVLPRSICFRGGSTDHVGVTQQPSGVVTLVFTDIVDSTGLMRELGREAYWEVLEEHRRIVRKACASRGGYEVQCVGDSFFYAFESAEEAL